MVKLVTVTEITNVRKIYLRRGSEFAIIMVSWVRELQTNLKQPDSSHLVKQVDFSHNDQFCNIRI